MLKRLLGSLAIAGLIAGAAFAGTAERKTFVSSSLGGQTVTYWLYKPANYDSESAAGKKFSCIYLLHWWIHTAEAWHISDGTRPNPQLDKCIDSVSGIICVSPQDETPFGSYKGTSWWVDSPIKPTWKYSSMLLDLAAEVDATLSTKAERAHRGLCGPSMGGFGTLHNIRVQTNTFRVAYAIVASTDLSRHMDNYGLQICIGNSNLSSFSPINHINTFKTLDMVLALQTGDCRSGCTPPTAADFFYNENVSFHNALTAAGVAHTWNDWGDTGHDYPLPPKMVKILKWFEAAFSGTPVTQDVKQNSKIVPNRLSGRALLVSQIGARSKGAFVGIDGRELKSLPATGIAIKAR